MVSPLQTWQHDEPRRLWLGLGGLSVLVHVGVLGLSLPYVLELMEPSGDRASTTPVELVTVDAAETKHEQAEPSTPATEDSAAPANQPASAPPVASQSESSQSEASQTVASQSNNTTADDVAVPQNSSVTEGEARPGRIIPNANSSANDAGSRVSVAEPSVEESVANRDNDSTESQSTSPSPPSAENNGEIPLANEELPERNEDLSTANEETAVDSDEVIASNEETSVDNDDATAGNEGSLVGREESPDSSDVEEVTPETITPETSADVSENEPVDDAAAALPVAEGGIPIPSPGSDEAPEQVAYLQVLNFEPLPVDAQRDIQPVSPQPPQEGIGALEFRPELNDCGPIDFSAPVPKYKITVNSNGSVNRVDAWTGGVSAPTSESASAIACIIETAGLTFIPAQDSDGQPVLNDNLLMTVSVIEGTL